MSIGPVINYPSPGAGLPSPAPVPAARPRTPVPRRKRYNPKNPWYYVFSGDMWRRPHSRTFYRVRLYHRRGMDLCRVERCRAGDPTGRMEIDNVHRYAAPAFKALVVRESLRPVRRPEKFRTGPSMRLWGWPDGYAD